MQFLIHGSTFKSYLLLADEASVVTAALHVLVDVGVTTVVGGGAATAASPGIGRGRVVSPRIIVSHGFC